MDNYYYNLTPWQNLEARGSYYYFLIVTTITILAIIFMSIGKLDYKTIILPTSIGAIDIILSYNIYKNKKLGNNAHALSCIVATLFVLTPFVAKYKYALTYGWELGLISYNSSVLILVSVAITQFLYNKKLYILLSYFAAINWIIFIIIAHIKGANINIITIKNGDIIYGFSLFRELFIIIVSIIIWYVFYRYIPILEAYDKETTKQKSIISDYSVSLEHKIEERTKELAHERNQLKLKNDILEHEIVLARKIQEQLIPNHNPTNYIYSLYKPMEDVGGDFFDFIFFDDSNKIGVFISDVSGHGVPAAFITSMIKTTILQAGRRKESPSELLLYINDVLQNYTGGNFITAFYCIYDQSNKSIVYSNAGHPQPYLITEKCVSQLQKGKNTALAIFPNNYLAKSNKIFHNYNEILPLNSKLLLYTDGLIEARPINGETYYENENMIDAFIGSINDNSEIFIKNIYHNLISFRGIESFEDDVCLICLDIK